MQAFKWIAALTVVVALSTFSMKVHAQVSCTGAVTYGPTFPGGTIANRTCNGFVISGVGSTPAAAQTNLSGFIPLAPARYCKADSTPVNQYPGGFTSTWWCSNSTGWGYYVGGMGSTATDLGTNTLRFAELYVASNVACKINYTDVSAYTGGFKAHAYCMKSSGQAIVSGVGSTATDTGINVRGFAELVASGNACIMSDPMGRSGLQFKAVFQCTRGLVIGYGSTATAAGNDALMQAQMQ